MELEKNIKLLLNEKGISQRDFVKSVGIDEANFSKYLKGDKVPRADTLIKIAKGLDCSIDELFGYKGKIESIEEYHNEKYDFIIKNVSFEDRLLQLAEECNELSQTILKWHRLIKGTNPPSNTEDVVENLNEEIVDVSLCLKTILKNIDTEKRADLDARELSKLNRWVERIND